MLSHDAHVDPSDIQVTVTNSTGYLDGSVPAYPQKAVTPEDARRTTWVLEVVDKLTVHLARIWTDQEIQVSIRCKLDHASHISSRCRIEAVVYQGCVTLSGTIATDVQRTAAIGVAAGSRGARL